MGTFRGGECGGWKPDAPATILCRKKLSRGVCIRQEMSVPKSFLLLVCVTFLTAFAAAEPCAALRGVTLEAASIGMPTRGAVVKSAKLVRRSGDHPDSFCKVLGDIRALDVKADPIRFELNLPEQWNGKAVQFGGGAFDGYLHQSDGLGATVLGEKDKPGPLARGYATFGSDSGHHHRYFLLPDALNAVNAKFALNDEERKNFASDALKKTHDVAFALMTKRYGKTPARMYFVGGSTGGREAMMVVDRWPADYDGVLAAYAAWNQIESDLQYIRVSQAMYAKGGWLPPAKTKLLRDAVMQVCDAQDGVKDGIINDPAGCAFDAVSLRCKDGGDHKGCLSDGQEATVAAFVTDTVSDYKVENGMQFEPGFNLLRGADLVGDMGAWRHAFHPPIVLLNAFYYVVGDGVLRFFLTKKKHFNALTFDWKTGGGRVAGILRQSAEDDASLADLTPFAAHGGKLLLVHGTADSTIPTGASVLLYKRIVEAMGQAKADEFLRLYLVPGYAHGRGVFNAGFDTVGVLDAWADDGKAPQGVRVVDQNKGAQRSMPLCAWPRWPRFEGGTSKCADASTTASAP